MSANQIIARLNAWLASTLEGAGLVRWGVGGAIARLAGLVVVISIWAYLASRMAIFSLCVGVLFGALAIELLSGRASARRREIAKLWPEVLDSLASAEVAGIGMAEAFEDLAEHAPKRLRAEFVRANARLRAGISLDDTLVMLKAEFGSAHADRLFEVLRMVNEIGARGYHKLLREQSRNLRADLALQASIETKQSWVLGTAKLAIAAPWLIVALLASRPENSAVYNSSGGASILIGGLVLCAIAYYLIHLLGGLPSVRRVLQ